MFALCQLYEICSFTILLFVMTLVVTHFLCRIFSKKQHLHLTQNSTVLITGGCMGIGKLMAQQIAGKYHCTIIIVDIRRDLFEQINISLTKLGSICQCHYCDLSKDESIKQFIANILQRNQQINLLISNAGIVIPNRALKMSVENNRKVMQVNYFAMVMIIKGLIPLLENKGHIAVVASMVSIIDGGKHIIILGVDQSAYTASKHAIYGYMSSLRQQLKKDKSSITISIGCPFAINTTMFSGFKTKLSFIFRVLDEKYVASRLIDEFMRKKQVCFIYSYQSIIFKLMQFIPSQIVDECMLKLDESNFEKIKNKHNKQQ